MPGRLPVVTLCGSVRFADEMARLERELTLAGHVVLRPVSFDPSRAFSLPATTAHSCPFIPYDYFDGSLYFTDLGLTTSTMYRVPE